MVYSMLGLSVINILLWLLILFFSHEWMKKRTPYYSLDADLLYIELTEGYASKLISNMVEHLTGAQINFLKEFQYRRFELEEMKEFMCTLPVIPAITGGDLCYMWSSVQFASHGMLFGGLLGSTIMTVSSIMLWWYAFVRSRRVIRIFIVSFYIAAPFVFMGAVATYTSAAWHVQEMVPRIRGGGPAVGTSVMFCYANCLLSCMPLIIFTGMFGRGFEEARNEARSESKRFMKDNRELYAEYAHANLNAGPGGYGAMDAAPAPMLLGADAQMQQMQMQQAAYYSPDKQYHQQPGVPPGHLQR
jgi:hypothetical protein